MSNGAIHNTDQSAQSWKAGAAITQYRPVYVSGDNEVTMSAAASTAGVIGFSQLAQATIGEPVPVRTSGTTLAVAGGSITRGAKCTPTTAGALVATTTAGDLVCAIALDAADSGDNFEVQIVNPPVRYDSFA